MMAKAEIVQVFLNMPVMTKAEIECKVFLNMP